MTRTNKTRHSRRYLKIMRRRRILSIISGILTIIGIISTLGTIGNSDFLVEIGETINFQQLVLKLLLSISPIILGTLGFLFLDWSRTPKHS